jgi:hypothetical protein
VGLIEQPIGEVKEVCAGLPDKAGGRRREGEYSTADIGLSAFSIFFMEARRSWPTNERCRNGHAGTAGRTAM